MTESGTVVILNRGTILWEVAQWMRSLPPHVKVVGPRGNQIPRQRNLGVLANTGAWVLFLDSDCIPRAETLSQLIHWNVPIVGGVVCERTPPWQVAAVKSLAPPERWRLRDLPREGLLKVPALGSGCLLVRREVFESIRLPWFRCGQVPRSSDLLLEDTEFCLRVFAEAGIESFLDCGMRIGHGVSGTIWPGNDGREYVQWHGGSTERTEPVEDVLTLGTEAWIEERA